jgi:Xaa-Pro aminopeptidase
VGYNVTNIHHLQQQLRNLDLHGMIVPSTDEFLSEFSQPFAQRLNWATGFSGSTGLAIVIRDRVALFLDGRYRQQGERDTKGSNVEVLDLTDAAQNCWLITHVSPGQRLGIDTRLQAYPEVEKTITFAAKHGIEIVELPRNPIDQVWGAERPSLPFSEVVDYPTHFSGDSATEKCRQLQQRLIDTGVDCHLLADPEDVAWLLNVRTHDCLSVTPNGWHIVPIPLSRAWLDAAGNAFWFVERARLSADLVERLKETVEVIDPLQFESFLEEHAKGKVVSANVRRTPHRFAAIVANAGALRDDAIAAHRRWVKHPNEIARAREGHFQDGQAVIRFLAWVQRAVANRSVTEIEAANKLTEFRNELTGYKGISMPLMSASGPSGAMAHYVPSQFSNRTLNSHPIYWMDSGAQYFGCSTDNTVCIAVGEPEHKHIHAHTLVVKGFIALSRARFPTGISSTQIDTFARQYLWQAGMDYRHGTGHGVGNFMNIHEGPAIRKDSNFPTVAPMREGMIVANEPAYYADGDFGIRIESHLLTVPSMHEGFLEFETISRLPIDPKLLDESLLTVGEKQWLADYHSRIADEYKGYFDVETAAWLQAMADSYLAFVRQVA